VREPVQVKVIDPQRTHHSNFLAAGARIRPHRGHRRHPIAPCAVPHRVEHPSG
jgi:hypothetical protein